MASAINIFLFTLVFYISIMQTIMSQKVEADKYLNAIIDCKGGSLSAGNGNEKQIHVPIA